MPFKRHDREYVKTHWIQKQLVPTIEDMLDTTIAWSVATSAQIAMGEARESWEE